MACFGLESYFIFVWALNPEARVKGQQPATDWPVWPSDLASSTKSEDRVLCWRWRKLWRRQSHLEGTAHCLSHSQTLGQSYEAWPNMHKAPPLSASKNDSPSDNTTTPAGFPTRTSRAPTWSQTIWKPLWISNCVGYLGSAFEIYLLMIKQKTNNGWQMPFLLQDLTDFLFSRFGTRANKTRLLISSEITNSQTRTCNSLLPLDFFMALCPWGNDKNL